MKKAAILGGNKLAKYLSIELKKKKFKTYHLSRKDHYTLRYSKSIKVKNYKFKTIRKKLNLIKPELVFNLISFTGDNLIKSIKINTILPNDILKWSIENNIYLILIGSAAEYGLTKNKKILEDKKLNPNSVYGLSKSLQSLIVKSYLNLFKNKTLLFRIFNLSGDISNHNTVIGKVNNFILRNKKKKIKKILRLYDLSSKRDYIDTEDAAKIIIKMVTKNRVGIFNLGSGKATLIRKIVYSLMKKYKYLSFKELTNKFHKNETLYISASVKKLKRALNEKN